MDQVIHIEQLGKKYRIRNSGYLSLRESLGKKSRNWFGQKHDESFWALKDIDLQVKKGERVGIIGRNGAGKSTLLKIISRITKPTTGFVRIRGSIASLLEVGTGFHPELTGRENIFFNGAVLGMKKAEIRRNLDQVIAFSDTGKFIDAPLKHFSSGMQMRLAFSVAAHLQSDILLVDEVLAVGDLEFQKKSLEKMQQITSEEGRTVLFVSHNLKAVHDLCDKGMVLSGGRASFTGPVAGALDHYISSIKTDEGKKVFQLDDTKEIGFTGCWTSGENGEAGYHYQQGNGIALNLTIRNQNWKQRYRIGLALNSMMKGRVLIDFTEVPVSQTGSTTGYRVWLPSEELTPGNYTVDLSILDSNDVPLDFLKDAVSFEILLANSKFEGIGYDYGVITKKLSWENVE